MSNVDQEGGCTESKLLTSQGALMDNPSLESESGKQSRCFKAGQSKLGERRQEEVVKMPK